MAQAARDLERFDRERESSPLLELRDLVDSGHGAPDGARSAVGQAVTRHFESRRAAFVQAVVDAAVAELAR